MHTSSDLGASCQCECEDRPSHVRLAADRRFRRRHRAHARPRSRAPSLVSPIGRERSRQRRLCLLVRARRRRRRAPAQQAAVQRVPSAHRERRVQTRARSRAAQRSSVRGVSGVRALPPLLLRRHLGRALSTQPLLEPVRPIPLKLDFVGHLSRLFAQLGRFHRCGLSGDHGVHSHRSRLRSFALPPRGATGKRVDLLPPRCELSLRLVGVTLMRRYHGCLHRGMLTFIHTLGAEGGAIA
eukprot:6205890-Pleurochrysis_carterae.AAC.6